MIVRVAEKEDLGFILSLSKERMEGSGSSLEEYRSYLYSKNMRIFVLVEDELVGYLLLRLEKPEAEIDEIAILTEKEGQGLANILLSEALASLEKEGYEKIFLEVRKSNTRAISLYSRNGLTLYRTRHLYYGDEDALCYEKELIHHER